MTMNRRALRIVAIVVGLVAVVTVVWFAWNAREAPVTPTQNVPVTYAEARTAPMHVVHVGNEKIACTECHAEDFAKKPDVYACLTKDGELEKVTKIVDARAKQASGKE